MPAKSVPRRRTRQPSAAEEIAYDLHSAALHLLRSLRHEDARLGVGPAGLSVLSVLVARGPKTMGDLARLERVRPPTMTRIVERLERWLLAERTAAWQDRRRSLVRATSLGRVVARRGRANRVAELVERLERFSAAEVALLARATPLIDRLARNAGPVH